MKVVIHIEYDTDNHQVTVETNEKGPLAYGVLEYARESFRVQQVLPALMPSVLVPRPGRIA